MPADPISAWVMPRIPEGGILGGNVPEPVAQPIPVSPASRAARSMTQRVRKAAEAEAAKAPAAKPGRKQAAKPARAPPPPLPNDDPLLNADEAAEYTGQSYPSFWRGVAEGRFPAPTYVAAKAPRWRRSWLDEAIERNRMLPRDALALRRRKKLAREKAAEKAAKAAAKASAPKPRREDSRTRLKRERAQEAARGAEATPPQ